MKKQKNRFFEISLLNVFFCMLVVFIHVSSSTISGTDKDSIAYLLLMIPWRLAACAVYGFIFLSGFKLLLTKSDNFSYGKFLLNRLTNIVLPYILWVFVYYLYFYRHNYFPFRVTDLLKYIYIGNLVSHFYFIIIIIQFYILAPFWIKLVKKADSSVALVFALILTVILGQNLPDIIKLFNPEIQFIYADRVFTTYLFYWVAGCYAGLHYEKFKEILKNNRLIITIFFIISAVSNAFLSYMSFTGKANISWLENIHVMYCISSILFLFTAAIYLADKKPSESKIKDAAVKFINGTDKISYGIYLAHCLTILVVDAYIISAFPEWRVSVQYLVRFLMVYIVTIGGFALWRYVVLVNVKKLKDIFFKIKNEHEQNG